MPKPYPSRASLHRPNSVTPSHRESVSTTTTQVLPRLTQAAASDAPLVTLNSHDDAPSRSQGLSLPRHTMQATVPVLPVPVLPQATRMLSRAERREQLRELERQHRRADRVKALQTGSIAAVASAILVAGVGIDHSSITPLDPHDGDLQPDRNGRVPLAIDRAASGATRAGDRPELPLAAAVAHAETLSFAATALARQRAIDAIDRATDIVATEARTTPELRDEILGASAVVLELVRRTEIVEGLILDDGPVLDSLAMMGRAGNIPTPSAGVSEANPVSVEVLNDAASDVEPELDDSVDSTSDDVATETEFDPLQALLAAVEVHLQNASAGIGESLDSLSVLAYALELATADLNAVLANVSLPTVATQGAPMTAADVLAYQIRASQADWERLQTYADSTAGFANGRLPLDILTPLSWSPSHRLRNDAAIQLERLNIAFYAEFGENLRVSETYRSFEGQVRIRRLRGRMAAEPGTSNHGWGIAVDFSGGINRFRTPEHRWMRENAHNFGWELPEWARERGRKPEPWHWEFAGLFNALEG